MFGFTSSERTQKADDMNKDSKELARHIDAMLAFQNGKDMEYCKLEPHGYEWTTLRKNGTLSFNWQTYDYRIKPKPREFWLNLYRNDGHSFVVHKSEETAKRAADPDLKKTIKVREVIE